MSVLDMLGRLRQSLVDEVQQAELLRDAQKLESLITNIEQLRAEIEQLTAQLKRMQTWQALDQTMEPARQAFRAEYPDMSEDEVLAFMQDIVNEVRSVN